MYPRVNQELTVDNNNNNRYIKRRGTKTPHTYNRTTHVHEENPRRPVKKIKKRMQIPRVFFVVARVAIEPSPCRHMLSAIININPRWPHSQRGRAGREGDGDHRNRESTIAELMTPNALVHTLPSTASPRPEFELDEVVLLLAPEVGDAVIVEVTLLPAAPDVFPPTIVADGGAGVEVVAPEVPEAVPEAVPEDEVDLDEVVAVVESAGTLPDVIPEAKDGGAEAVASTSAPVPQGIFSPSGWVEFGGAVVAPEEEAIANLVVH